MADLNASWGRWHRVLICTLMFGALCAGPYRLVAGAAADKTPLDEAKLAGLAAALDDPVADTRRAALEMLKLQSGPTQTVPEDLLEQLRNRLDNRNDAQARLDALQIARALGPGAARLSGLAAALLTDQNAQQTVAAIEAIGAMGPEVREARDAVRNLVDSKVLSIQAAARAVVMPKPPADDTAAMQEPWSDPASLQIDIDGYLDLLEDPEDRHIGLMNLSEVEEISDAQARRLAQLLRHRDPETRAAAATVAGQLRDRTQQFAPQLAVLLRDSHPSPQLAALESLASMGSAGAKYSSAVTSLLKSRDPEIQASAIEALARMNPEGASTAVLRLSDHPDPRIREAVTTFMAAVDQETVRRTALGMGTAKLRQLLDSKDPGVRARGLLLVERLGSDGNVLNAEVTRMLRDRNADVRIAALKASVASGGANAHQREAIVRLLSDTSESVRQVARDAVARIDALQPASSPAPSASHPTPTVAASRPGSVDAPASAASSPSLTPADRLVRRVGCLGQSLAAGKDIGETRLGCYLQGPLAANERLMFRFVNDQAAGVFPAPDSVDATEARDALRAMSELWSVSQTHAGEAQRPSRLRDYASRVVERLVTRHGASFGEGDLPLLRSLQAQLDRAGYSGEARSLENIAGQPPSARIEKLVRSGSVIASLYIVLLAICFWCTRWSRTAFRILTEDGLWKWLVPIGPALAIAHSRLAILWVFDQFFRSRKRQLEKSSRALYLGVPLHGPDDRTVDSARFDMSVPSGHRVWIQGSSGMGKSSLFADIVDRHFRDSRDAFEASRLSGRLLIPLEARKYADGDDKADADWMLKVVRGALTANNLDFKSNDLMRDVLSSGHITIAIDGLNESGKSKAVQAFMDLYPATPLLITSQDNPLPEFEHWRLPADVQTLIDQLLDFYLGPDAAKPLQAAITQSGLRAEIRSGYDVRLIYEIFQDEGIEAVPSRLEELYERLLTIAWPRALSEADAAAQKADLATAAWRLFAARAGSGRRHLSPSSDSVSENLLKALASSEPTRLVRHAGGSFEFVHDQMNAYLAARHLSHPGLELPSLSKLILDSSVSTLPAGEQRPLWIFLSRLVDDARLDGLFLRVDELENWGTLRVALLEEFPRRGREVPRRPVRLPRVGRSRAE